MSSSLPASYALPNVISVAASRSDDKHTCWSNVGVSTVHIAAPGDSILSTYRTSDASYATLSGTSMATPITSGAIALLAAAMPNATAAQLK